MMMFRVDGNVTSAIHVEQTNVVIQSGEPQSSASEDIHIVKDAMNVALNSPIEPAVVQTKKLSPSSDPAEDAVIPCENVAPTVDDNKECPLQQNKSIEQSIDQSSYHNAVIARRKSRIIGQQRLRRSTSDECDISKLQGYVHSNSLKSKEDIMNISAKRRESRRSKSLNLSRSPQSESGVIADSENSISTSTSTTTSSTSDDKDDLEQQRRKRQEEMDDSAHRKLRRGKKPNASAGGVRRTKSNDYDIETLRRSMNAAATDFKEKRRQVRRSLSFDPSAPLRGLTRRLSRRSLKKGGATGVSSGTSTSASKPEDSNDDDDDVGEMIHLLKSTEMDMNSLNLDPNTDTSSSSTNNTPSLVEDLFGGPPLSTHHVNKIGVRFDESYNSAFEDKYTLNERCELNLSREEIKRIAKHRKQLIQKIIQIKHKSHMRTTAADKFIDNDDNENEDMNKAATQTRSDQKDDEELSDMWKEIDCLATAATKQLNEEEMCFRGLEREVQFFGTNSKSASLVPQKQFCYELLTLQKQCTPKKENANSKESNRKKHHKQKKNGYHNQDELCMKLALLSRKMSEEDRINARERGINDEKEANQIYRDSANKRNSKKKMRRRRSCQ